MDPIPALAIAQGVTTFRRGGTFTVGAEEELLLVRDDGSLLGPAGAAVVERLSPTLDRHGTISGELFVDEIELGTRVCTDGEAVAQCLGRLRRRLRANGARAMAVGVHPTAQAHDAHPTHGGRYDLIGAELAGLLRTPVAAFQVHVALPDQESAILAYRGLRNWLPALRALAASSPFWFGRDSGLAAARPAILQSYPRVDVPPLFRSYDEYVETVESLLAAAGVPDYTYVWWDLRPHPRYGTLEVRAMDSQWSLARIAGLTTLVQGLARHAVEAPTGVDVPDAVLRANDFRAWRYGIDGSQVGPDGVSRPARELARGAVRQARSVLAADGLDAPLDAIDRLLREESESERQRSLARRSGLPALVRDLTHRTMAATPGR